MPLLRLVTWSPEAPARQKALEAAGFKVAAGPAPTKQLGAHFRDLAPDAIVIDMDRLPSHGRAVAVVLRTTKSTRLIPIVFTGGEPEKIARARADMPDACFTDWNNAPTAIKRFLREPPSNPVQPPAYMEQFAGASLIKKLGFKAGMKVAMLGAPEGFDEQLGELPPDATLSEKFSRSTKLVLWFVRSAHELESEIEFMSARLPEGASLWIVHRKKTGTFRPDFNQNDVRNRALDAGLVDYKVCAVDAQWSGLKFTRKKT